MKSLFIEYNDQNVFNIEIFIKAGSVYETSGEHGLAHLLEHMMFKSKKNINIEELLLELNYLGGEFNALTGKDYTSFYIKTIDKNWKRSTELLNKIVFEPIFKTKDLKTEKKIVIEEFLQMEDDIKDKVFETAYSLFLHPKNPYGASVKGTLRNIKVVDPESLHRYYNKHYSKCIIYINCDKKLVKDIKPYLLKNFSTRLDSISRKVPYGELLTNTSNLPVIKVLNEKKAQNSTIIMFQGFAYSDKRTIILELIWDILAGSLNSLLMMEMREKRGLVYRLSAFNDGFAYIGTSGLYFTSSTNDISTTILYIMKVLKKIRLKGLSKNILTYSKASYINKLQYQLTDLNFTTQRAMMRHYYGCKWDESSVLSKLRKITNEDIISICQTVFDFTKMCVVTVGNYKSPNDLENKIRNMCNKL
jgi:predicted Zn-dependent peptidase